MFRRLCQPSFDDYHENPGQHEYSRERDDMATVLVGDEDGVIALISIDKKGGKGHGIVQNGENTKFTQRGGGGEGEVRIKR